MPRGVEEAPREVAVEDRRSTESMSVSKSATNADPTMKASVIALEISDLPPPETVAGLWHDVAFGTVPMRVHEWGSCGCWATVTR